MINKGFLLTNSASVTPIGGGKSVVFIDAAMILDLSDIIDLDGPTYCYLDAEGDEIPITADNIHNLEIPLHIAVAGNPE